MKMIIASGLAAIIVMSALVYNAANDKIEPQIVEQEIEIEKPTSREIPVTYIDMVNELTSAEPPKTTKFNLSDDWRLYIECMVAGEVGGESRWDKYGHTMSGKFYRTENWAEWCLSKKLR